MQGDNRLKILPIEWDLMTEVLRGRVRLLDLPEDIEVVGVQNMTLFRMLELIVKSETFPPLMSGAVLTRMQPLLRADFTPEN